jgi:hypothetical protein
MIRCGMSDMSNFLVYILSNEYLRCTGSHAVQI